jgi:hypothetical protein
MQDTPVCSASPGKKRGLTCGSPTSVITETPAAEWRNRQLTVEGHACEHAASPVLNTTETRNVQLDCDTFVNMVASGVCPMTVIKPGRRPSSRV